MVHLTSCLLLCLMSAGSYVAAPQNAAPLEAWPPDAWMPRGALSARHPVEEVPGPRSINSQSPLKNSQAINPKSFGLHFHVPTSRAEDGNRGHDRSHSQPARFSLGTNLGSSPQVNPHLGSSNYPNNYPPGAPEPGLQLSVSVPFPKPTTAAPLSTRGSSVFNAGFSYSGPAPNILFPKRSENPSDPLRAGQKPPSRLVSFLAGMLNQRGQGNPRPETSEHVNFKPLSQGQSGSSSRPQSSDDLWTGTFHVGGSSGTEGNAAAPVRETVHKPVQYPPQWHPVLKPQIPEDVWKSVLQSVQYVDGKLMIPLEKCPGFEKFAKELYRGHGRPWMPPSGPAPHQGPPPPFGPGPHQGPPPPFGPGPHQGPPPPFGPGPHQGPPPPFGPGPHQGPPHFKPGPHQGPPPPFGPGPHQGPPPPFGPGPHQGPPPPFGPGPHQGPPPPFGPGPHQGPPPPFGPGPSRGPLPPHAAPHGHLYQYGAKPSYAEYSLNAGGAARTSAEPRQGAHVQLPGLYHKNPFVQWQGPSPGGPGYPRPGQTYLHGQPEKLNSDVNFMVHLGSNTEYNGPYNSQGLRSFPNRLQGRH